MQEILIKSYLDPRNCAQKHGRPKLFHWKLCVCFSSSMNAQQKGKFAPEASRLTSIYSAILLSTVFLSLLISRCIDISTPIDMERLQLNRSKMGVQAAGNVCSECSVIKFTCRRNCRGWIMFDWDDISKGDNLMQNSNTLLCDWMTLNEVLFQKLVHEFSKTVFLI